MSNYCLTPSSANENIMFVSRRNTVMNGSPSRSKSCLSSNINNEQFASPPRASLKRPFQDVSNSQSSDVPNSTLQTTPTKSKDHKVPEPVTPTAKLKMLSSLADCLPYANKENKSVPGQEDCDTLKDTKPTVSRKEKSLGLLCNAFLRLYPLYIDPSEHVTISLDEVARQLVVERRRVYDIVNVLESVGMVVKEAKNKYRWFGKSALYSTLPKLKALADKHNIAAQIHSVKDFEFTQSLENSQFSSAKENQSTSLTEKSSFTFLDNVQDLELRKEKSMGIMSQRFLMLFLASAPKTVSLDLAAKVLIGDPTVDKTQSLIFKTKIRRLYDIANILSSLELIQKVTVTEARGRKSAFQYIGPDVGSMTPGEDWPAELPKPQSRHSLISTEINADPKTGMKRNKFPRTRSDDLTFQAKKRPRSLIRYASLHDICEVAEIERQKLYSSEHSTPCVSPLLFDSDCLPLNSLDSTPQKGSADSIVSDTSQNSPKDAAAGFLAHKEMQLPAGENVVLLKPLTRIDSSASTASSSSEKIDGFSYQFYVLAGTDEKTSKTPEVQQGISEKSVKSLTSAPIHPVAAAKSKDSQKGSEAAHVITLSKEQYNQLIQSLKGPPSYSSDNQKSVKDSSKNTIGIQVTEDNLASKRARILEESVETVANVQSSPTSFTHMPEELSNSHGCIERPATTKRNVENSNIFQPCEMGAILENKSPLLLNLLTGGSRNPSRKLIYDSDNSETEVKECSCGKKDLLSEKHESSKNLSEGYLSSVTSPPANKPGATEAALSVLNSVPVNLHFISANELTEACKNKATSVILTPTSISTNNLSESVKQSTAPIFLTPTSIPSVLNAKPSVSTPVTPTYYTACVYDKKTENGSFLSPQFTFAHNVITSPQFPIFSPSNCVLALSPVIVSGRNQIPMSFASGLKVTQGNGTNILSQEGAQACNKEQLSVRTLQEKKEPVARKLSLPK